jgi:hypothetical protein
MTKRRPLAPLLILLILGAVPLYAQTLPAPGSSADSAAQETKPDAVEQEAAVPESSSPKSPAKPGSDSPFDYRSSEQISEDLSVSFPVDI